MFTDELRGESMIGEDFRFLIIGFILGLLCSLVLFKMFQPEMSGAIKNFKGEIKCEQLKNDDVVCYEVKE